MKNTNYIFGGKLVLLLLCITILLVACNSEDSSQVKELKAYNKAKSDLTKTLMKRFSVSVLFDSLDLDYSIDFDSQLGQNQLISEGLRILDITRNDSTYYINVSVGAPRKYLKLSLSKENLKLLKEAERFGSIQRKILIVKISTLKKLDFVLQASPKEEFGYTVQLSERSRNFIGEGTLIEVVPF